MPTEDSMIMNVEASRTKENKIRLKFVAISGGCGPELILEEALANMAIAALREAVLSEPTSAQIATALVDTSLGLRRGERQVYRPSREEFERLSYLPSYIRNGKQVHFDKVCTHCGMENNAVCTNHHKNHYQLDGSGGTVESWIE